MYYGVYDFFPSLTRLQLSKADVSAPLGVSFSGRLVILVNISLGRRAIASFRLLGCTACRARLASMRGLLFWSSHAVKCRNPAGIGSGLSRLRSAHGTAPYPVDGQ